MGRGFIEGRRAELVNGADFRRAVVGRPIGVNDVSVPACRGQGALGGIIAGVLAGLLTKFLFDTFFPDMSAVLPWSMAIFFGFALTVVGIVGDLVESLLKRDADIKDTGALLPGMGGILDRIDAALLAVPVMHYMLLGYFVLQSS